MSRITLQEVAAASERLRQAEKLVVWISENTARKDHADRLSMLAREARALNEMSHGDKNAIEAELRVIEWIERETQRLNGAD